MKYEYQIIEVGRSGDLSLGTQQTILTELGAGGWEVFHIAQQSMDVWFYCRRAAVAKKSK